MTSFSDHSFVETREYRRFHEFCEACQHNRYIGLCYGPPGVGKTLSANYYASSKKIEGQLTTGHAVDVCPGYGGAGSGVAFYTPPVVNSPGTIEREIARLRAKLRELAGIEMTRAEQPKLDAALKRIGRELLPGPNGEMHRRSQGDRAADEFLRLHSKVSSLRSFAADPTALILIDEADRLKEKSLEQVRDIFDRGGVGVVLIGMPGLEKRLARYAQLYSRVGFVHEFRPLSAQEVRSLLLSRRWHPPAISLPEGCLSHEEGLAAILRVTGGNFRLLDRLLTQIARVLEINRATQVTGDVVDAARESLVIGTD
jgi:DNA transposition AAA+ family ATPase